MAEVEMGVRARTEADFVQKEFEAAAVLEHELHGLDWPPAIAGDARATPD